MGDVVPTLHHGTGPDQSESLRADGWRPVPGATSVGVSRSRWHGACPYEILAFNQPRRHLDFDALDDRALRLTDCKGDPAREGFSTITRFANASVRDGWAKRPKPYAVLKANLNDPGLLAYHKYGQVVDVAERLGSMRSGK